MANLRAASSLEGLDKAMERSGWESGAGHGYDDDAVLSKAINLRQAIRLLRPHGVQHFGALHARRLFGQSILQCEDDSPAHGRGRACGLVSSRQGQICEITYVPDSPYEQVSPCSKSPSKNSFRLDLAWLEVTGVVHALRMICCSLFVIMLENVGSQDVSFLKRRRTFHPPRAGRQQSA